MASKSKVKNQVKGHNSQKAHLHPLRDVCMQYENNLANGLRDVVRNWTIIRHQLKSIIASKSKAEE